MIRIQAPKARTAINGNKLLRTSLSVPGSKYIANRLGILALLAKGTSIFKNFPQSEDMLQLLRALEFFGAKVTLGNIPSNIIPSETAKQVSIQGCAWPLSPGGIAQAGAGAEQGSKQPAATKILYTGDSGTLSRFIVAVSAIASKVVHIDCSKQMRSRPMQAIFEALRSLGATVHCLRQEGFLPAKICGPLQGGEVHLGRPPSSQFISSLLLSAPYAKHASRIHFDTPLVSAPYISMTIMAMKKFGVVVEENEKNFFVPASQSYVATDYSIEGDPVAASYFYALALLSDSKITVENIAALLKPSSVSAHMSLQGEAQFPLLLQKSGAVIQQKSPSHSHALAPLTILSSKDKTDAKPFQAIRADMNLMPDIVPTAAVLACISKQKSVFTNIAHLRYKESNRIDDMALELRKAGLKVESGHDFLAVTGKNSLVKEPRLHSHGDHRLAMALSLLALKTKAVYLEQENSVDKSYPEYFNVLKSFGFTIETISPGQLSSLAKTSSKKKAASSMAIQAKYKWLVFIGYRAVGKSTLAKKLAKHTGLTYFSTDAIFEKQNNCMISEFVRDHGWPAFRLQEAAIVAELCKTDFHGILDCGGGLIENTQSMDLLASQGYFIWIECSENVIIQRLLKQQKQPSKKHQKKIPSRPALTRLPLEQEVSKMLAKRKPLYSRYAHLSFHNNGSIKENYATLYARLQQEK